MEKSSQINIIHQLNYLNSGLNFIIPSQWWNQLLNKNEKIQDIQMMEELDDHPLKFLYQIDLLQICFQKIEQEMNSLQNELSSTIKIIDSQLKDIKRKQRSKLSYKRSQSQSNWWRIRTQSNVQQKKMPVVSPRIRLQELNEWFDNPDWRVVSPSFYKLLCQNKYITSNPKEKEMIIGIPIFLDQIDGHYQITYKIKQQIYASIYFHNLQTKDYCFIGYIEPNNSFFTVTHQIYLTCQQMTLQYQQVIPNNKRNKIYLLNQHLYYRFQDYQKINQDLPWQHADQIGERYLQNVREFKMIEISTYSDQVIENVENLAKMIEEKQFRVSKGKKVKQNEGFQYHESTEGQTQQSKTEKSFELENLNRNKEQNILYKQRIAHPIFTNEYDIPHLKRLCKQSMKKSIEIPFSSESNRIKTQFNKDFMVDKSCNKLSLKDSGEYQQIFQQDNDERSEQNLQKKVPKEMILWLQRMSLTIFKPQIILQKLQRQQMVDNIKQKLQLQSQTQKMQQLQDQLSSSQL